MVSMAQVRAQAPAAACSIAAPVAQVYFALTNPIGLAEWLCDTVASAPRTNTGDTLFLRWDRDYYATLTLTHLNPDQSVGMHWRGRDEAAGDLLFDLEAEKGVTHLTLHRADDAVAAAVDWADALENLASVLATGNDLRLTRRPILGVLPEKAKDAAGTRSDVAGVRIAGTLPGGGAETAGLQAGDVVLRVNGCPVNDVSEVSAVLHGLRAGDVVPVLLQRGGATERVDLSLMARPLPQVPDTPDALADGLMAAYALLDDELRQLYDGVSARESAHRPGPTEWSADETVAHLIGTERWTQEWIGSLIAGGPETGSFSANQYQRAVAIAASLGGREAVLDAMRRAQAETVLLVRLLPPEIAQRRSTFARIGQMVLGLTNHNRTHWAQIQHAIQAARA